jgi:hypothetical protein
MAYTDRWGRRTSWYTPSGKHNSTYLHCSKMKLDINDSISSASVPLSLSLLSLSLTSYMHKHTACGWLEVSLCMWDRNSVSNSIVCMHIFTLPSHPHTPCANTWCTHCNPMKVGLPTIQILSFLYGIKWTLTLDGEKYRNSTTCRIFNISQYNLI